LYAASPAVGGQLNRKLKVEAFVLLSWERFRKNGIRISELSLLIIQTTPKSGLLEIKVHSHNPTIHNAAAVAASVWTNINHLLVFSFHSVSLPTQKQKCGPTIWMTEEEETNNHFYSLPFTSEALN